MGINVTLRGGSGDMLKTTYDPNLDGVIAVAETEADMKKSVYDSDADGLIKAPQLYGNTVDGALVDYVVVTDKVLDNVATPDSTTLTTFQDVGTPYTIAKADMDEKSAGIKITIACEMKSENETYRAYTAYNIDGGADQAIGDTTLIAWTPKSVTLVVASEAQVIQFRARNHQNGVAADIQNMVITQTHAARKDFKILNYY